MSNKNLRPWFADEIGMVIKAIIISIDEVDSGEYKRGMIAFAKAMCTAIGIDMKF